MKRPKPVKGAKDYWKKRRASIQEVVREVTAGGIVFRKNSNDKIEILLIQDPKDRWTIPKGHIELDDDETARECAEREIKEETGLKELKVYSWLGKINFRYRRKTSLVLMTTHIYLVKALGDTDKVRKESFMNGIGWFELHEALDKIEYKDIEKLILLGMKRIRQFKLA